MAIEIRQMSIKSNVVQRQGDVASGATGVEGGQDGQCSSNAGLSIEVLRAECRRIVTECLAQRGER